MGIPTPEEVVEFLADFGVTCKQEDSGCSTFVSKKQIQAIISNRVIPFIEGKVGFKIGEVLQYVEYYDGNGSDVLTLNRRPIVALIDLSFVAGSEYPINVGSIVVNAAEGLLKSRASISEGIERRYFSKGRRNIKITYTAGYAETPADLCSAILLLAANHVLQQIANRTGGGNIQTQAFTRDFGPRGKWGIVRTEYVAEATEIIRGYCTGVVG